MEFFLIEIFEHLRIDLISTFGEVRRVMKPGAIMLLFTPNLFYFRRFIELIRKRELIGGRIYDEHLKLYSLGHIGHVRIYLATEIMQEATVCFISTSLCRDNRT